MVKNGYPITKLDHDLWGKFPEWLIKEDSETALTVALQALNDINDWHNKIILELVQLYDILEKDRKESNGEVPVKACYIYQQKLLELILGTDIKTARMFLTEMDLMPP
jgi:hypothetical protein